MLSNMTATQRNRLKSLSDTPITVSLPRLHLAQQTIKAQARRFNVIRCGRRFGKDVLLQDIMITSSLHESFPFAWFAPTYRMLLDNWRHVRNTLAPVTIRANDSEHRLELINGSIVEMWSLDNHDAARGRKYRKVFINEAAMIKSLQESWEMVIRPTLADYAGGAYIASTPRGMNYFYTLDQLAESNTDWQSFHYRTSDNPHIAPAEIDELRRMLPASTFQQEIEAEYMTDGSYFQNIEAAAVIESPDQPDQHRGHTIVMGVDWAKSADWTVLTIGCRDCNRVVDWRRFNQIDYHYQRRMLADVAKRWNVNRILAESNSIGEPNIEELARAGLPVTGFTTTANSKAEMIEALHLALVNGGLKVPKDYADELRAFEIEIRSGAPKFGAPVGLHDDRVISLALCNRAMITGVRTMDNPFYN